MKFSEEEINELADEVKLRLSEKRYLHTLSVLKAANHIGQYFECVDLSELSAAALLHDVTKELPYESHLKILEKSGDVISCEDRETPAVLHSLTAPFVIMRDFSKYATKSVLSAVKNHTLGAAGMSVFDRIIFIADYVEDSRIYESCIEVRGELYGSLSLNNKPEINESALNKAVYRSLDFTEKEIIKRGRTLNLRSNNTKEYFCKYLNNNNDDLQNGVNFGRK